MTRGSKFYLFAGLAILFAVMLSPFASKSPDGLEKIAQDKGFAERGESAPVWRFAALRDYAIPGVHNEYAGTAIAGLLGAALVFGAALGAGKLIARKHSSDAETKKP
jgi:cobalt/nickel transport protein